MGNLSFDATREEILEAFGVAGRVVDVKVPTDRETGRPRGFAFVEFESDEAAQKAIEKLNGQGLHGRALRVNEAENRPARPPGAPPADRPAYRPSPSFGAPFRGAPEIPLPFPPPSDAPFGKEPRKKFRETKEQERPRRQEKRRRLDIIGDDDDV